MKSSSIRVSQSSSKELQVSAEDGKGMQVPGHWPFKHVCIDAGLTRYNFFQNLKQFRIKKYFSKIEKKAA